MGRARTYPGRVLPLVCLDVDGTLVGTGGEPSERLWAAADRARERGQRLTLCTARLAAGPTRAWAERLDPDGWHVFHTGAVRWRPADNHFEVEPLPDAAVAAAVDQAAAHGWVLEAYTADDYAVDSADPLAVAHADLLALPFTRRPLTSLDGPIVRVQYVVPSADTESALAAAPPGTAASGATSPLMPGAAFVSVTVASVSKAAGIAWIADHQGADLADVMMVGDGHNDLPAFAVVGWPVAMGNADAEVRAEARLVVATVDDDGAAEALDRSADLGDPARQ